MPSSGATGIGTSGTGWATLIAAAPTITGLKVLVITNEGAAPGFFSVDGGATVAGRIPAGSASAPGQAPPYAIKQLFKDVMIKRDGSSDMTNVYGSAS